MPDDPYKPPATIPRAGKPAWSYAFRDLAGRTTALKVLLWAGAGGAVIALGSDVSSLGLLSDIAIGRPDSIAQADADNIRQALVGLGQGLLFVITGVVFLMWLHRANSNAQALTTRRMSFGPGWAVGWNFVPIWNLWMPFQVMKEIWTVSQEGARLHRPPGLLVVWWVLWLADGILSFVAGRMMVSAINPSEDVLLARLQVATSMDLVSQVLHVGLCIVVVRLVSFIHRMQLDKRARHQAAAKEGGPGDPATRG